MKNVILILIALISMPFAAQHKKHTKIQKCNEIIPHVGQIALGQACCVNNHGQKECVHRDISKDEDIFARKINLIETFSNEESLPIVQPEEKQPFARDVAHTPALKQSEDNSRYFQEHSDEMMLMFDLMPLDLVIKDQSPYSIMPLKFGVSLKTKNFLLNSKFSFMYHVADDGDSYCSGKTDRNGRCHGANGQFAKLSQSETDDYDIYSLALNFDGNMYLQLDGEDMMYAGPGLFFDAYEKYTDVYANVGFRHVIKGNPGFMIGGETKLSLNYFSLSFIMGITSLVN